MGAIGKMKPQIASVEMLTESARRRASELKRNQDLGVTRRTQRRFSILNALQDILGDGDDNSDESFSCDSIGDSVGPDDSLISSQDMSYVTRDSITSEPPQTPSERGHRYRRRGSIIDANVANIMYAPERDESQQPSSFRKRDSRIGSAKPSRASRAVSNESTSSTPSHIKPSLASVVDNSPTSQSVSAIDRSERSERRKSRRSAGGAARTPSPSKVTKVISSAHARLYSDYEGDNNNSDSLRSRRSSASCQPSKSSGAGAKNNKVPKSLCSPPLYSSGAPSSSKPRKSKISPEAKQPRKNSISFPFPADDDKSVCSLQASSSSVMTIDDRPIPRRSSGASPSSSSNMSANGLSLSNHRKNDVAVPESRPRSKSVSAQLPLVPNLLSPGPLLPRTSTTRKSGSAGMGNGDLRRRIAITSLPMGNFEIPMSPGSVCSEPCFKAAPGGGGNSTSNSKRNSKVVSPLLKKRASSHNHGTHAAATAASAHLRPPMTPRSSLPRNSVATWDEAMLAGL